MHTFYQRILTGFFLIALVIATLYCMPPWGFALFTAILLGIILTIEWPRLIPPSSLLFWFMTPFYPVLPFLLVIKMQLTGYKALNMLIIALVALYDTSSYLIGSMVGTRKINAFISPGKSWEGYIGGTFLTTLIVVVYAKKSGTVIPTSSLILFTISICFCALLGDLFESLLKRRAGVKDSGSLLPGHGGVLDRVDGMMFVSVMIYLFRNDILKALTGIL